MYMCPLILKLSSVLKLLILTAKLLVNIKTRDFYSCLILTENFVVSIKSFHPLQSFKTNHSSSYYQNLIFSLSVLNQTELFMKQSSYFQQHDLSTRENENHLNS
jgi:hypothetical protein